MRKAADRYPRVEAPTRAAWRAWLEANHAAGGGSVWLVINRKGSGLPHLPPAEASEEALCFGWVDSRPAKLDERRSLLLVSPRKPGSAWSGINKERVRRLAEAGLMAPAGLLAVERAKADGSWERLDGATALSEPKDLLAAFAARPGALEAWRAFPPSHRRANLEWVAGAKRPDTRAARVAAIAGHAERGERANTWRRPAPEAPPGSKRSPQAPEKSYPSPPPPQSRPFVRRPTARAQGGKASVAAPTGQPAAAPAPPIRPNTDRAGR